MRCAKCGKEVGDLFCAKCRAKVEGKEPNLKIEGLFPLIFWDVVNKRYVFRCTVVGCPCNRNGLCASTHLKIPMCLLHEFDGDNIIKQLCG